MTSRLRTTPSIICRVTIFCARSASTLIRAQFCAAGYHCPLQVTSSSVRTAWPNDLTSLHLEPRLNESVNLTALFLEPVKVLRQCTARRAGQEDCEPFWEEASRTFAGLRRTIGRLGTTWPRKTTLEDGKAGIEQALAAFPGRRRSQKASFHLAMLSQG